MHTHLFCKMSVLLNQCVIWLLWNYIILCSRCTSLWILCAYSTDKRITKSITCISIPQWRLLLLAAMCAEEQPLFSQPTQKGARHSYVTLLELIWLCVDHTVDTFAAISRNTKGYSNSNFCWVSPNKFVEKMRSLQWKL